MKMMQLFKHDCKNEEIIRELEKNVAILSNCFGTLP